MLFWRTLKSLQTDDRNLRTPVLHCVVFARAKSPQLRLRLRCMRGAGARNPEATFAGKRQPLCYAHALSL